MASLEKYITTIESLESEIQYLDDCAQINDKYEFVSARKIQAWYRGILTRNHIRNLNFMALIIQRNWRSYQGRIFAKNYLIQSVMEMWKLHYNKSATCIQAAWRGYYVRKNNVSIKQIKQWCQEVKNKNKEVLEYMKNFRELKKANIENAKEEESLRWILFILYKLHYLLGTKKSPGILTRLDETQFTLIEKMIRCFEYSFCKTEKF